MSNTISFLVIAVVAVLGAVGVLAFKSPIRSAISLVINFLALGILYFMMNLDLLGISQILVYTGLIMMLFLFCILLLNLGAPNMLQEKHYLKWWVAVGFAGSLVVLLISQVIGPLREQVTPTSANDFGTAKSVGTTLFTNWVYAFEICSVLLLVGIVGSILLAKRRGL